VADLAEWGMVWERGMLMMRRRMEKKGGTKKYLSDVPKKASRQQKIIHKFREGQVWLGHGSSWKGKSERGRLWFCLDRGFPFSRVTSS
jgi:hypothetical protein